MTEKNESPKYGVNRVDEAAVQVVQAGEPVFGNSPTVVDELETSASESDASAPVEPVAGIEEGAGSGRKTGSAAEGLSLKHVLTLVQQVSRQVDQVQKDKDGGLKAGSKKLVESVDQLTARAEEVRSMLDGLSAAGARALQIGEAADRLEEATVTHSGDFHRWSEAERRRRWRWPGLAMALAVPAFLLLGVLLEQRYQVVPLHDPTGGWSRYIWDNYGDKIVDCTKQAKRAGGVVKCSFDVHRL